jgi:hypothetical protein
VKRIIFPLLIAISLGMGLLIPGYHDWTGSEQSRPSPLLLPTAGCLLLSAIIACGLLRWLPVDDQRAPSEKAQKTQFQIRTILVITALAAILLVALAKLPLLAVSSVLQILALGYLVRSWVRDAPSRWPAAALLSCMYLPYAWIVTWNDLTSAWPEILWLAFGLPSFLLTLLVGGLLQQHPQNLQWLSMLLTSGQLAAGVWVIQVGTRRLIAWLIFSLLASVFGSFILNALFRM